jgi:aminomethyltransferase
MLACGLGARDTLRTEMGYPLHGQDITIEVTPNQADLGWAVGWKKDAFWGRDPLVAEKEAGPVRRLRGLVALERGIPRPGMSVSLAPDVPLCEITSGTFSPTLRKGIGMALVPTFVDAEAELGVQIRTRREIFASTKLPFVDTSVRES